MELAEARDCAEKYLKGRFINYSNLTQADQVAGDYSGSDFSDYFIFMVTEPSRVGATRFILVSIKSREVRQMLVGE